MLVCSASFRKARVQKVFFSLKYLIRCFKEASTQFIPQSQPASEADVKLLQTFFDHSKRLFVLTGAGLSTESGIPDYRSEGVGLYARSNNRPVQHQDFIRIPHVQQRYWARNYVAWPKFSSVHPNANHHALVHWEQAGKLHWLVTQNVDALHITAGSQAITELHGSAHRVHCLSCGHRLPRTKMQHLIASLNPHFQVEALEIAPDGDVILTPDQVAGFKVPPCPRCGGLLKPEIVFFGDNVPTSTVDFLYHKVDSCDALLVAGSSLEVYSGLRFVSRAHSQSKPVAVVNIGPTRADKMASVKISARCGEVIPKITVRGLT